MIMTYNGNPNELTLLYMCHWVISRGQRDVALDMGMDWCRLMCFSYSFSSGLIDSV